MLDLLNPTPPPARVLSFGRVLPLLLAVLTLFFIEVSAEVHAPVAQPLPAPPPKSRLVMFWVDSLSTLDLAVPDRLLRLKARLPTGLHGPVRACMDAVSVPCFTAASTGLDRFSLFSMIRNFGGSAGVPPGSVFHALQHGGARLGFVGDPLVAQAVQGFDWVDIQREVDDPEAVRRGLDALDRERLDVVVIHQRLPDEISHRLGPDSRAYADAMEVVDREIDGVFARLRPTDHVVVFGDHGHTPDGRHFAGLDVATYLAAFGPLFSRPARRAMAITDYGALWARVFGLRFGDEPWIEAYFSGDPLPSQDDAELPGVASGQATLPPSAVVLGVLLAILVSLPHRVRWLNSPTWRALLWVLLALAVFAFATGLGFTALRPLLNYRSRGFNTGIGVLCGLLGIALAWPARRLVRFGGNAPPATGYATIFLTGTVLLALPTVYKFGGTYSALTGLLAVLAVAFVLLVNARNVRDAALCLGLGGLLALVWNPAVQNFAMRGFSVFAETLAPVAWPVTGGLALVALGFAAGPAWRPWALGAAAGLALTAAGPLLPPRVFIVPCVLLLPLALGAQRAPRLGPLLALVAPPALTFFFGYDPARLAPVVCALACFPLWARLRAEAPLLERGVGLVVLLWLMLWTMLGCRISGLDFNYFFRWLPEGANVEDTWGWNTLLTTTLYVGAPMTGLLLARRAGGRALDAAVPVAWHVSRLKLGLVLLFIVGFSIHPTDAGPFITADVLMEAGVWVVVLLFLLPLPHENIAKLAAAPPATASED